MNLTGKKIGVAITGSFCTLSRSLNMIKNLVDMGCDVTPIFSEKVATTDTRFFLAGDFRRQVVEITGKQPITDIVGAEPIGPKKMFDIMVVAPCTGNTLAKLAQSMTDSSVTMACKAHLRNNRPLVIAVSTNDGLSGSAKNIGKLLNYRNVYFVPFGQDDPIKKARSLVADFDMVTPTLEKALDGEQIQPIIIAK
ncbi:MAG: dipicolinate synthase subunit B [Christensenellales bacterium]